MVTKPPGTEESAFISFAFVDELIRTLVNNGTMTADDVTAMLERIQLGMRGMHRPQAASALRVVQNLLDEYRQ